MKNDEIIFTEGKTNGIIENKYNFESANISYSKNNNFLKSKNKSTIKDNKGNVYKLENFVYEIDNKILKGNNINVLSKIDKEKIDNYFFSEGFLISKIIVLSLKIQKLKFIKMYLTITNKTQEFMEIHPKEILKTVIKNGIFTSCKINDSCPPWSIKSETITHDKFKKNIIYENAILQIYDVPVLYFPKFFIQIQQLKGDQFFKTSN